MDQTVCNPMDLSYCFSEVKGSGKNKVAREAADPTLIRWKERYWLFPSMSNGFWISDDMVNWEFIERPDMPVYDHAPDIQAVGDSLYFTASSRRDTPIYRVDDPVNGKFEEVCRPLPLWDPHLHQDEDGRVYLYWGCSNKTPIRGVVVDRSTMLPIGKPVDLITGQPDIHGWERIGENNGPDAVSSFGDRLIRLFMGKAPYIEGAYMTKHHGQYYLQYAAPGTELAGYGNGVYVGTSPLGPFTYQPSNPFSYCPGGFMTGAGHGSILQDCYSNWWHVASMRISLKYNFERRLGLFPAGFDDDGTLFCNQNFRIGP